MSLIPRTNAIMDLVTANEELVDKDAVLQVLADTIRTQVECLDKLSEEIERLKVNLYDVRQNNDMLRGECGIWKRKAGDTKLAKALTIGRCLNCNCIVCGHTVCDKCGADAEPINAALEIAQLQSELAAAQQELTKFAAVVAKQTGRIAELEHETERLRDCDEILEEGEQANGK